MQFFHTECNAFIRITDQCTVGFGAVHRHGTTRLHIKLFRMQPVWSGQNTAVTTIDHLNNKRITALAVGAVIEPGCDRCFHSVILESVYRKIGHRPRKSENIAAGNNPYISSEGTTGSPLRRMNRSLYLHFLVFTPVS